MFSPDVESRLAVETSRVDDQRVSFIPAHRFSHPRGFNVPGKLASIRGNDVEYIVRFVKIRQTAGGLHDLQWILRLHGSGVTPGQAKGRIVKFWTFV